MHYSEPRRGVHHGTRGATAGPDLPSRRRLVLCALAALLAFAALTPSAAATTTWRPGLTCDFNALDARVWNVADSVHRSNESSLLLARNVTVSKGRLRIQAKQGSVCGYYFTAGALDTYGRYSLPNYFIAKVRAKLPQQRGMWPAPLWFRAADAASLPSGGGEIDLVESIGRDAERGLAQVRQAIHSEYTPMLQSATVVTPFTRFDDDSGTGWHTYLIMKTPHRIVMQVDGTQTALFTPANVPWFDRVFEVPTKRWVLRVNLQVGGAWAGLPDSSTDWRTGKTALFVDYIHTWTG